VVRFGGYCIGAWGQVEEEDAMEEKLQLAEAVREACIAEAVRAYEDAGMSGLCHEGRWEYAVDAMRAMPLRPVVEACICGGE
jgi:hypothetical protein